jgi:hypothetical protein
MLINLNKRRKMKKGNLIQKVEQVILSVLVGSLGQIAVAQTVPTTQLLPDTAKMTYNQISTTMKLYVFPAKNQTQQQQKEDEFACYQWAVEQSGIDPLNLPKAEVAQTQTGPDGSAVKGAAKGAAAGAAIGAISGDAGQGAAIGATAGAVGGKRKGKQAQAQQNQQAQAEVAKSEQEMKDDYKKAFSVCIEGKGYTIK